MPRLTFRRTEDDTATDVGYSRADGQYAAVRIADTAEAETVAGQSRVLAEPDDPRALGRYVERRSGSARSH